MIQWRPVERALLPFPRGGGAEAEAADRSFPREAREDWFFPWMQISSFPYALLAVGLKWTVDIGPQGKLCFYYGKAGLGMGRVDGFFGSDFDMGMIVSYGFYGRYTRVQPR